MNEMSLKARIRNIADEKNVTPYAVLQNYLMGRFLLRLNQSEYKDKFVVKGGMLISSIIGIDQRTTLDLDITLRNIPLTENAVRHAIKNICSIRSDDGIVFEFKSIEPIRDNDGYGGFRVRFNGIYGKINAAMSMDVSTGDVITPGAGKHVFTDILDENITFELWSYPNETILAEKIETTLSRGTNNTRPRDFYDVYMIAAEAYDKRLFAEAFRATSEHRGSYGNIKDYEPILKTIAEDPVMRERWSRYVAEMPYAKEIRFEDTIAAIRKVIINCDELK